MDRENLQGDVLFDANFGEYDNQDILAVVNCRILGSKARGDEADSDTDIAIIVQGLDRSLKRQILDIVTEIELKHLAPLSTLIMSKADFDRLKTRELRLADDIEREGFSL